jgi:heparanase 1
MPRPRPTDRPLWRRRPRATRRSLLAGSALALVVGAWLHPAPVIQNLGKTDPLVRAGLTLAYGDVERAPAQQLGPVEVTIGTERPLHELDARFVSVALDTSQVLGGRFWSRAARVDVGRGSDHVQPFDLGRPRLLELARALAPAYLRIGGTEADHVYYSVTGEAPAEPPPDHELVLSRERWDALGDFARAAGFDLYFTVNAGPGPRDSDGAWQPDNAASLLAYAAARHDPLAVLELGNEVNGYWFIHGPSHQLDGARYGQDLASFRALVLRFFPAAKVAGPASAFFPVVGEPTAWSSGTLSDLLAHAGGALDIVSWHYYPQQSRRCPVATRRAASEQLLNPAHLDEVTRWATHVEALRDRHAANAEVWLGETGNAQCGGEPELSDRFEGGLWWLDQLGALALRGQPVVVRQTLAGSNYGLLDDETLTPAPDYYNTLLWKRLMGKRVLEVSRSSHNPYLRLYAHCTPSAGAEGAGKVTLLALNLHPTQPAELHLEQASLPVTIHELSAPSLNSRELYLDGQPLSAAGSLPKLEGRASELVAGRLVLSPTHYAFVQLALDAPACRMPWPS